MELFNEAGAFIGSTAMPVIFGAALDKTPIKTQAIKLAQKHVADKLRIACVAGVITKWAVQVEGLTLRVEAEFPPQLSQTDADNGLRFKINTVVRINRTYSLEDVATDRSQKAMLNILNEHSTRH